MLPEITLLEIIPLFEILMLPEISMLKIFEHQARGSRLLRQPGNESKRHRCRILLCSTSGRPSQSPPAT